MDFTIGCNYWASNAGCEMWRHFDSQVIREDLYQLTQNGIETIRIFPIWSDFQPIIPLLGFAGDVVEYRFCDGMPPKNKYFLDEDKLSKFETFCDIAEEFGIKVIVALLTGWMSGRLYVPSALYGKSLFTDPTALLFEQYFIKGFISRFKSKPAIIAWEAGNECNCIDRPNDSYTIANWSMIISNAIRSADATRPIISTMHYLSAEGNMLISDQAECCDYLVTHPYPYWSELGYMEYTATHRTFIHATALMKLYGDIGKKPTMIAEIGTMGNMVCNDENSTNFIRLNIIEALAHGVKGLLWWCAYNQTKLNYLPYTTNMCEQELGLIYEDRAPKPMLTQMHELGKIISELPDFEPPKTDAVCLLTCDQHQWRNAFATYSLASRSGLNIQYAFVNDELPESDLYIMPGIVGNHILNKEIWKELLSKVYDDGATLYISNDSGYLAEFESFSGNQVIDSGRYQDNVCIEELGINAKRSLRYTLKPITSTVLYYDTTGNPAVTLNNYGKGRVIYVNFPLEASMINDSGAFDGKNYKLYKELFEYKTKAHSVKTNNPLIGLTTHQTKHNTEIVIAVNYSNTPQPIKLEASKKIKKIYHGDTNIIEQFDYCIFEVE